MNKGPLHSVYSAQARIMKTCLALTLLAASLAAPQIQAQFYVYGADPVTQAAPVPAVVYQAPVVYEAPVLYQAPVVYQAPVIYQMPEVNPWPTFCGAEAAVCPASPTVIYFGGPDSFYKNAAQGNPCSPVIYFGRGEGSQRGYQFTHPR